MRLYRWTERQRLTKNTIEGEAALAFRNISRTALSDSPTNLLRSCRNNARISTRAGTNNIPYFGSFYSDEVYTTLTGAGASENSFTTTWRSIEEHTLRRPNSQSPERFWVQQRPLDGFLELLNNGSLTADVCVSNGGCFKEERSHRGRSYRRHCGEEVIQL